MVDLSSSPEVFQRSDQVVSNVNSLSIFHRRRSHSVASTVVTGSCPRKLLGRHMKSISAPRIQSTFSTPIFGTKNSKQNIHCPDYNFWKKLLKLNFKISYLLLPPEGAGAAGRPPWNGAGRFWGGGLLGRLFPPNRLKGFLKNCAEAQAKKSTAKVSNTLMVAKLKNEFQIQNEFSIFSKFFEINLHK